MRVLGTGRTFEMEPTFAALQWAQGAAGALGNRSVVDSVPAEMRHLIDPHWYQFPPMNPLWHGILGFVICVLGIISVIGNFMVVYVFSTSKSLKTPSNLLVVNLAFSDFLMMTCMFPPMVVNCYYETWVFGPFMCELYAMLGSLFGCASIWTMTMIANDRYNVIVKGISAAPMTNKTAMLRILFIWSFALVWTLAPMFGWNRYVPEGNMTACGTDYLSKEWLSRSYILVYSVFVYFLPLFMIIYSYYFILSAVSAHEKNMREQAKKMNVASLRSAENANASAEGKLAKVALTTISLWFMAWTPYLVINYAGIFETATISPLFTIWGSLFAKANAVYNPIVYAISHPKYKIALEQKFPSLSCASAPADDGQSVASGTTNDSGMVILMNDEILCHNTLATYTVPGLGHSRRFEMEPTFAALQWAQGAAGALGNRSVVDSVPAEMRHLIDPHWYQFPPMNPLWHGILGFVICVLGIISVIGNFMVVYVFSTSKSLKTPSNLLVVNLAFSDFLMMTCMFPPMVVNCYYETWVFGPFMCELYAMLGSLFGCASIWTMTMIANDRYNVIVKGISAAPMTNKTAMLRILFIWSFALVWTLAPMFGWNRYVPEGNMTACGTDYLSKEWLSRSYILVYSVFVYFLPLFMIIYSYYFILSAVSAHEKNMREQAKKMNVASLRSAENANASAEGKLAKVALTTISLWFMAWTPYLVINYAGIFETATISPLFTIWGSLFAKANAVYNPIVYAISHPKYKIALEQKFPSLACASAPADDGTSVASGTTNVSEEKA
ncbi:hypothetical protein GE061_017578 [Apolygus lucorum]|uniref:G-protein coupled receptors family 1 profile domain-containing protein n=1 Tax=Apolygus lucorum TaxID=248454 RepID=A0A8S9XE18_APOLU|nr:hypothetical protein GE061_017578 [Apolygus lucorum]